jgi:glycosyltransferase involved in cell wall biosynthesis
LNILIDSWYSKILPGQSFDELLKEKYLTPIVWLASRFGVVRGLCLYFLGQSYDYIVTSGGQKGSDTLLVISAIARRKNVILLQFIRKEKMGSYGLIARFTIVPIFFLVRRLCLRHSLRAATVLTKWEVDYYNRIYKLESDRLQFIPWYYIADGIINDIELRCDKYDVFVAGGAALDWELIFNAAQGQDWRVVAISKAKDLSHVERLSKNLNVKIFSAITQDEYNKLLMQSSICVLPLKEMWTSVAHIRISNAIYAGVPIVCTNVRGVEGYLVNNVNSLLTEAGNILDLRDAINLLFMNRDLRVQLATTAMQLAKARPRIEYLNDIKKFISSVTTQPLPTSKNSPEYTEPRR